MSNPLFAMMGGAAQGNNPMLQRFAQFQKMFRGDPKEQVQQLLNSGRVSQAQYNQAVQTAQQMARMLGGMK